MDRPRTMTRREQMADGLIRQQRPNFVSPQSGWEPMPDAPKSLPAQQVTGIPITTQPITIDPGGRSFDSLQGDYENHTRALLMKFSAVVLLQGAVVFALLLLGLMQGFFGWGTVGAGWLVLTGALGLFAFVLMDREAQKHTPVGSERHRVDLAAEVAMETHASTVEAWRDVNVRAIDAYYGYLERGQERDERARISAHSAQEQRRITG